MNQNNKLREEYFNFVREYFGEIASVYPLASGREMLRVAPPELPQCCISCGRSFGVEDGFELMFSLSPSWTDDQASVIAAELDEMSSGIRAISPSFPVLPLSEGLASYGYSHVLPWPVGEWERTQGRSVPILVLIPLYEKEARWIEEHSAEEFAFSYHGQVGEEAFFNLDVARPAVDPEREETSRLCELPS